MDTIERYIWHLSNDFPDVPDYVNTVITSINQLTTSSSTFSDDVTVIRDNFISVIPPSLSGEEESTVNQVKYILNRLIEFHPIVYSDYRKVREDHYPPLKDQLDMLYWDKKNGTNNWEQMIDTIKAKYPKSIGNV